jgi:uncharacterized protein YdbL (DUF1318 family)
MSLRAGILAAAVALAAPAFAQSSSAVSAAIAAGQAGERFDGYLGVVGTASEPLRRQVNAINLRRRNLYIELASRRQVTPEVVGLATACELFAQLPVGEAYLLNDNVWRRRAPGQAAPVPNYCR